MEKRLQPTNSENVAKLLALMAQAEYGDYDHTHQAHNIYSLTSNIEATKTTMSPQELFKTTVKEHNDSAGMKPSAAFYWFLKEASKLESFGEEIFPVKPATKKLGVGPHGITKYEKGLEKQMIPFTAIQSASSHSRFFRLDYISVDNIVTHLKAKMESNHAASGLYRAITEKYAFYNCETVHSAVTEQCIRDLKGTIASIFNEGSSLGKKYVFDIRRTCREVYDNARRALYVENTMLEQTQVIMAAYEGKQYTVRYVMFHTYKLSLKILSEMLYLVGNLDSYLIPGQHLRTPRL